MSNSAWFLSKERWQVPKKGSRSRSSSFPSVHLLLQLTCPVAAVRVSGLLELLLPVCGAAAAERHGSHRPVERGLDEDYNKKRGVKEREREGEREREKNVR